jgi:hypothetical protein
MLSGEPPAVTVHHALLASDLPPLVQKGDTMLFMVGTGTPSSCCSIWNGRRWSAVAASGERPEEGRQASDVT